MFRIIALLMALTVISSCATTEDAQSISYYLLDPVPAESQRQLTAESVQLLPIDLPDYLRQNRLVIRKQDNQIQQANYHSWADSLSASIRRVLINDLNGRSSDFSFVADCRSCQSMRIAIDHFYPTEAGRVVLSGLLEIEVDEQSTYREQFFFSNELRRDGFDNSVGQMRELLEELGELSYDRLSEI